eukprot:3192952-Rhodomonas_salina.4
MAKPWRNPAILVWMQLLEEFEPISDTLNGNLLSLSKIAMSVKDEKNKDSIQALKQKLSKELANVDKAFPDVLSFTNHLIASGVALCIKKLTKGRSKCTEVYKISDNKILAARQMKQPLSMMMVDIAIAAIQSHLERMPDEDEAAAYSATQEDASEVDKLKVMLAQCDKQIADFKATGKPG